MRIISNFRDYYDCMQANGFDPMIVYGRLKRPQFIDYNNGRVYRTPYGYYGSNMNTFEYGSHTIGFCGKWYLYFEIFNRSKIGVEPKLQTYCVEDVDKFVEKNFSKKEEEFYYKDKDDYSYWKTRPRVFSRKSITDTIYKFNNPEYRSSDPDQEFIKNGTPIIVHHERKTAGAPEGKCYTITYDDCLKDYSFFKVVEPWQAYQELSMYVGGPLVNNRKVVPEMDNKTKVQSHGFDKYSFRLDPKVKK